MTRRVRLQLSSVDQVKSLKRRAGLPVCSLCWRAAANSAAIAAVRRTFLARPKRKSTLLCPHQCISCSRANPASARNRMRTRGQQARRWPTMRATSSTSPALASMLLGRQKVPVAEDVKRQVAVAIVIAMEEAALLVSMQRVVGGIEIEDDLPRRTRVALDKQIDQ